jgi:hypothetical protein
MAAQDFVSGENRQVTIYKDGAVSTAQEGIREKDNGVSELQRKLKDGWSLTPPSATSAPASSSTSQYSYEKGISMAKALYTFFPEDVTKEFAKNWVKYGNAETATAATRQTAAWKKHFSHLEREDGTLIMTEAESMSTLASFRETLGEVGIGDTTQFEEKFKEMIKGEVSAAEFQDRINLVYEGVKNQIPEVEALFRDRYGIESDSATIFAALIDPDIEDKLLKGEITTLQLQAEASSRGFSSTFARFDELRKQGLTQQQAKGLYAQAGTIMSGASRVGRDLTLETIEQSALGDVASAQQIQKAQSELASEQAVTLGAARKNGQITGLIEG